MGDICLTRIAEELYEAQDHHLRIAGEAVGREDMVQWQKYKDIAAGIRIAINILMENDPRLRKG